MKKRCLALLVAGAMMCSVLTGCTKTYATDLMDGVKEGTPTEVQVQKETWTGMYDFSVKLLQTTCDREDNTLVSPMSVLSALAMTANGAQGETRTQMEEILGGSVEQLNGALTGLGQENDSPLYLANSIWFAKGGRITPNPDFLQVNADCYRAGVFEAPFDQTTVTDINRWVKEHTHGMVEEILKEIPRDTVMYLINALAFEGEWENPYQKEDVWQQAFTNQEGKVQQVSMMHSEEQFYLRDDQTQGFMKYYQGGRYAFVALLPDKGISILDYVKGLDGQQLKALLDNPTSVPVVATMPNNPTSVPVVATMPKFESEMEVDLQEVLKEMGMVLPFDGAQADFTGLGTSPEGNLFINQVFHKAYLEVQETGTRGGAATAVEINCEGAFQEPEDQKVVTLDRPFVYLVVDTSSMLPVFMGTVLSV